MTPGKRSRPEENTVCESGTTGRRWVTLLGAGMLLALPVAQAQGQEPGAGLELTGYVGAVLPLSQLVNQGDTMAVELSTKPVFGASLDYWFGGSWGIDFMAGFSRPDLTVSTVDPVSGIPVLMSLGTVDFLHAEATLQYRPNLPGAAAVLLPYFGIGAGIRSLSFPDGSGFVDSDDVTLIINAGAHIKLSERIHLRLDIRDLVSSFASDGLDDSKLQNEFLVNVGLGVGL